MSVTMMMMIHSLFSFLCPFTSNWDKPHQGLSTQVSPFPFRKVLNFSPSFSSSSSVRKELASKLSDLTISMRLLSPSAFFTLSRISAQTLRFTSKSSTGSQASASQLSGNSFFAASSPTIDPTSFGVIGTSMARSSRPLNSSHVAALKLDAAIAFFPTSSEASFARSSVVFSLLSSIERS